MSQTTEIPFIGVHNTTTENLNENGEVAMSFGLTSNDVAATTTMPAVTHLYHIDGCRILLIHNGSGFKNVFVARPSYDENGEVKKWTTEAYTYEALINHDETPAIMCSEPGLPNSTAVLGNVVVLNYDDRCRYAFRKNDTYVIRDNTLPPIVFEARAAVKIVGKHGRGNQGKVSDPFDTDYECGYCDLSFDNSSDGYGNGSYGDKSDKYLSDFKDLLAADFVAIRSEWMKKGYLFSPICIRLAYRMKSGELAGHTNIVCVMPETYNHFIAYLGVKTKYVQTIGVCYTPFIKIISCAGEEYKDIISGIEIYTSSSIKRDDISAEKIKFTNYGLGVHIGNVDKETHATNGFYAMPYDRGGNEILGSEAIFTLTSRECTADDFSAVHNFYHARTIDFSSIDEMNGSKIKLEDYKREVISLGFLSGYRRVFIDNKNNYIDATDDTVCTRPSMSDPLRPNIPYCVCGVYSYNKRILEKGRLYKYSDYNSVDTSYYSGCENFISTDFDSNGDGMSYPVNLCITEKNIPKFWSFDECIFECYSINECNTFFISCNKERKFGFFNTCEEPYVKKMFGFKTDERGAVGIDEYVFTNHSFLNMSVMTMDRNIAHKHYSIWPIEALPEDIVLYNKIKDILSGKYTTSYHNDYIRLSNVGDPYSFDASNTAYFNSPVERVMIVPEAITLGQYGTDQIYVICQDGVYTVGLNDEGKLTRVNTFTSDKIDANRACIAGGQLFVNNGISWDFYQGQNRNQFLSMKRNTAFHFDNLPHILSLNETKQWEWCLQGDNLFDFMQRCTLYYDSINAQIIGVVPNTGFYLVWSKDDGFRMVKSNAEYRVQYNTLLLADNNSNLYDFEATDTVQQDDGMVIMRPFHLNAEQKNGLSTVRSVIVRGNFDSSTSNCSVKIILYGTMDYKTWHVVSSSTRYYITGISGTPYAAFRLVILAKLKRDEYLSHITVEYDNKESKRLHF